MFESDDLDQVLSQFDIPELELPSSIEGNVNPTPTQHVSKSDTFLGPDLEQNASPVFKGTNRADFKSPTSLSQVKSLASRNDTKSVIFSPKHLKRKMINSYFDTSSKRKFPGPAGLLSGSLEESKDDNICQMELLSQDIDFSQNNMRRDIFESPLWTRLLQDASHCNLGSIDNIKSIKQQALSGNLRCGKAQAVVAFVESVDRSATDPLVILRDSSANIKCTLHRDAWCAFSFYITSEYCAFILKKPTVLTTGSAFKKHYLNITLSNIFAIYSSAVLEVNDDQSLPDGYRKVYEEDFTVIQTERPCSESGFNISTNSASKNDGNDDLLDGLDSSIFLDESF